MIISFTGSQSGMTLHQRRELKRLFIELKITELVHGDCVGSDLIANQVALEVGCKQFSIYPSCFNHKRAFTFPHIKEFGVWHLIGDMKQPETIRYRIFEPEPPLERNKKIVDMGSVLIATPKEFKHTLRSGTWATIRYAWKKKKEVIIIAPILSDEEIENNETNS